MRSLLPLLVSLALAGPLGAAPEAAPVASSGALTGLRAWIGTAREARPALDDAAFARVPLTKEDAARATGLLWDDHAAFLRAQGSGSFSPAASRAPSPCSRAPSRSAATRS